jgi:hypothetical protein
MLIPPTTPITKFAEYDPQAPQPSPVLGWYDTSFADYPNLPEPGRMLALTEAQWVNRLNTPLVQDGLLVAAPPAPRFVPQTITNYQCRAALTERGLFDQVDAAIRAQGGLALQAWEYANEVSRGGTLAPAMAAMLGFSDEDADEFFIEAATIVA